MVPERILPQTYQELKAELDNEIAPFDALFLEALSYFDTLLSPDGQSSPAVEDEMYRRFKSLLDQKGFLHPRHPRETLIRLAYGYSMQRPSS